MSIWHGARWHMRLKSIAAARKTYDSSTQLWTTKYAPAKLNGICGNKGQVEKIGQWLEDWCVCSVWLVRRLSNLIVHRARPKYYKSAFKKGGPAGMGLYRAILISGGPGIGKTTSAHLMSVLKGYNPIELNASDARSKKLVEVGDFVLVRCSLLLTGQRCRMQPTSTTLPWTAGSLVAT